MRSIFSQDAEVDAYEKSKILPLASDRVRWLASKVFDPALAAAIFSVSTSASLSTSLSRPLLQLKASFISPRELRECVDGLPAGSLTRLFFSRKEKLSALKHVNSFWRLYRLINVDLSDRISRGEAFRLTLRDMTREEYWDSPTKAVQFSEALSDALVSEQVGAV
jgi:hypothetical protein